MIEADLQRGVRGHSEIHAHLPHRRHDDSRRGSQSTCFAPGDRQGARRHEVGARLLVDAGIRSSPAGSRQGSVSLGAGLERQGNPRVSWTRAGYSSRFAQWARGKRDRSRAAALVPRPVVRVKDAGPAGDRTPRARSDPTCSWRTPFFHRARRASRAGFPSTWRDYLPFDTTVQRPPADRGGASERARLLQARCVAEARQRSLPCAHVPLGIVSGTMSRRCRGDGSRSREPCSAALTDRCRPSARSPLRTPSVSSVRGTPRSRGDHGRHAL